VLTVGDDGFASSTYTWAVARDARTLRVGVDHGSNALANLMRDGQSSVVVIGERGFNHLITGHAREVRPRITAAAPAEMALWEITVNAVRDQSWPGVETTALRYRWPRDRAAAMRRMERAVAAEMRAD